MVNILVTGANGQLGSEIKYLLANFPAFNIHFTDIAELDITNEEAVNNAFTITKPKVVINCAAYTAVDKAESDEDLANKINWLAPKYIAKACAKNDCLLIHVSTDYVFDGTACKPYSENVRTSPNSVYGMSKLKGEEEVLKNCPNSLIVRTSWLYSTVGNNFVKTMLRLGKERDELGVIYDQVGTPTYAHDLADTLLRITKKIINQEVSNYAGIYHFSNEGACSWYDFSKEIFTFAQIDCNVKPLETFEYPTPAKRPHYSVLNKRKIKETFGITIPYWKDSLYNCLKKLDY